MVLGKILGLGLGFEGLRIGRWGVGERGWVGIGVGLVVVEFGYWDGDGGLAALGEWDG